MKLQRKNTVNEDAKRFHESIEGIAVHDVTGDENILIVRIKNKDNELKGLWLEKRNDAWVCLQEDIDDALVAFSLSDPLVKKHTKMNM